MSSFLYYSPIAHQSKNAIAHQPKSAIAGPQKPGFFRNNSRKPTASGKNPVSWIIDRR
ncbi:hypothetical protein IQ269_20370 [Tychonema sp. LEGE 07199]|uniref:hypothetical protein n=1 Tax=unclassified Tychonema TaxID=2642144 RepID=UPI00187E8E95|nr:MULTISPECIES: hypothetical protein [unclassified Tychonema]MBE9123089.1 hypothetical protein [Tychonema sp. LEGE 07199]MBE9134138.1 hypothetical protein [Tychonema sp. LEGE 07196]